jgi:hypothetical protein
MSDYLFSGLKVIDCASWIAGPAAATIMSDFGADVIKIEPPDTGDPADVIGTLRWPGDAAATWPLATRALTARAGPPDGDHEIAALARHPLARWRARSQAADPL